AALARGKVLGVRDGGSRLLAGTYARRHDAGDADIEELEHLLPIAEPDPSERRNATGLRGQDHRVGRFGGDRTMLVIDQREVEPRERGHFDDFRGGEWYKHSEHSFAGRKLFLYRVRQVHVFPPGR